MISKLKISTRFAAQATEADFEQVYQRTLPRVYNFFRYRFGDDPLAEDLTSETFEKAWRQREKYQRDLGAFSTWLFTIARNVAIDHFRKPRNEVPLHEALDLPSGEITMDDLTQQNMEYARLASLLAQLADRDRELVALKYGAGLTNRAIARLCGLSESNVAVILHRLIQTLPRRMGETMNDDFLNRFQKPPRIEFAATLYKRINQPMKTQKPASLRLRTAFIVVTVLLVAMFAFSPVVRAFARQGIIQLRQLLISHDPTYAEQFESRINSGTPTATLEPDLPTVEWQAHPLLTLEEASIQAGFPAYQVSDVPENASVVMRFVSLPDANNRFTRITTTYQSSETTLVFTQTSYESDSAEQVLPAGNATVTTVTVQGVQGTWIEGLRLSTYVDENNKVALQYANLLIWEKDGFEFQLQSTPGLSLEELLKIAKSIF